MTTIIDREVKQLRDIAASLSSTKKRLSEGEENLSNTVIALSLYQSIGKSITDMYGELVQNTEWLSGEFGYLAQIYRDIYTLTYAIDKKILDESLMSEEALQAILIPGRECNYKASDTHEKHFEYTRYEFDRKTEKYLDESFIHSGKEPMSLTFVKWFEGSTRDLIDGVKIAIDVVDDVHSLMKQILEPLPPLELQKTA